MSEENPFDVLGVDPRLDPQQLTEALRQRAERAMPEERKRLQGMWRKLTLKEADRVRWALLAHPRPGGQSRQLDELAGRVPPFLSRRPLPPLRPSALDALVAPEEPGSSTPPVRPPHPGSEPT